MKRRLARTLASLALGVLGSGAWAQTPAPMGEPATVGEVAQKDPRIEIAPVPHAVEGPLPVPAHGVPPHGEFHHGHFNAQGDCCDEPKRRGYFTAGVGVYYMQPNFETNPAFGLQTTDVANNIVTTNQRDFSHGAEIAPLAWVGWVCDCGVGVRIRWFNFDADSNFTFTDDGTATGIFPPTPLGVGFAPFAPGANNVFNFASNLRVDVWDLEGTKNWCADNWSLLLAGGVRYAHMSQDYSATGPIGGGVNQSIVSGHNMNGIGPTIAFEGKRNFGGGGFGAYGNARGSVLFGTAVQTASAQTTNAAGTVLATQLTTARQADTLPIGELEIGGEYGCDLGKMRVYAQLGFVGQVWWGAGNASNTAVVGAADNSSNFGFVGGVFRVGVNY